MHENVNALLKLGRIPSGEISAELFEQYDTLLQTADALTYEEAAALTALFSDGDPDDISDESNDLNWALLHAVETVYAAEPARYQELIEQCGSAAWKELLQTRLNNAQKEQGNH